MLNFQQNSLSNPYYPINSVDGLSQYTWIGLKSFINQLMLEENDGNQTWVNIPEYSTCIGSGDGACTNGDHNDHNITGMLVTHALQDYANNAPNRCISSVSYVGYATGNSNNFPTNYSATDRTRQKNAWDALNAALIQYGWIQQQRDIEWHDQFLYKEYRSSNSPIKYYGPC